ncbi:MAG: LytTR family transcriptional regulator [Oscillospiraceae bacterium]|nr:LytTR family transcriptional regulator [Oscillospiraceae bacterium]
MEVKIRIVPEREAPALVLETPALTPQVERLAQRLSALDDGTLPGFQADKAFLLETARLTCLYAQDKGVYARREDGEVFALRLRLYELEQRLDSHTFVRISHSEIVNLKKITALDLTLSGTIKISLVDGAACYVSRRYVKKIKQALGL